MSQHVPKLLFKYRSLDKNNKTHTLKMLTEGQIYFANLRVLNDPQDFYFMIDRDQYCRLTASEVTKYSPKKIIANEKNSAVVLLNQQAYIQRIRDSLCGLDARGIFSVTERNNNPDMFNYYANNGRGICISFAWEEMNLWYDGAYPPQKQIPNKVNYRESPLIIAGRPNEYLEAFFTKQKKWSYEEEWRFFYKQGTYTTKEIRGAIKQIVFGMDMAKPDENEIREAVKDLPVTFFKASSGINTSNLQLIKSN